MANECLVTKLKGSVDNKFLPLFGYYRFEFEKKASNSQFVLNASPDLEGIRIYDSNMDLIKTDFAGYNHACIYQPTANGYLDIPSFSSLEYIETTATFKNHSIKCSDIPYYFPNVTQIRLRYEASLYGDVTELVSAHTSLNLTKIEIYNQQYVIGTLESLCEKMFNAGRTSGILNFIHETDNYRPHASMVSFHGEDNMAPNCTITFNATGCEVYGTRASAIVGTLSNGVWTYA